MAYVSQEDKKKIAPKVKEICNKYGIKASLAVRHHSTLLLNIKSGKIDFANESTDEFDFASRGYLQASEYHLDTNWKGSALKFLKEIFNALKGPDYFDQSDVQSDYFYCSHYVYVNIGDYEKPYVFEKV